MVYCHQATTKLCMLTLKISQNQTLKKTTNLRYLKNKREYIIQKIPERDKSIFLKQQLIHNEMMPSMYKCKCFHLALIVFGYFFFSENWQ